MIIPHWNYLGQNVHTSILSVTDIVSVANSWFKVCGFSALSILR